MKKNKFKGVLFFLLGLLVFLPCVAEGISPDDFAYGLKLEFTNGKSIYDSFLSTKIYESVTRSDLGDLRVFNSSFEVVPHEIIALELELRETDVMPPRILNIFPIYTKEGKDFEMKEVKIKTNNLGTVVEVGQTSDNKTPHQEILSGYVVDASTIETPIEALVVDVDNPAGDQFFKKVSIRGSDDLKKWAGVDSNAVLANLVHQEESLVKNVIKLPRNLYKYYLIGWSNSENSVNISKLTARFGKKSEFEKPKLNQLVADGAVDAESESERESIFIYKLNGYFPISSVQIVFTQPNSLANITLESRNNDDEQWESRQSKTVFSMVKDGAKIEDNEVTFSPRRFRYWRLKFNSQKEAFGSQPPRLRFGWASERLRFLARGTPPFFVGFGSARIKPLASLNLQDKKYAESIGYAIFTEYKVLGGDSKLTYVPPKVYPWKSWILWAVLIFGVYGLGKMALNLTKTLKSESNNG